MATPDLLDVLNRAAEAVVAVLADWAEWGLSGARDGQYHSDLAADRAAVEVLTGAGLGVLSEESGHTHGERAVTVVLDPLDGSTNASRRLSWWATSLCAVDDEGPAAAVVVDLVHGTRYEAVRGEGARVVASKGAPVAAAMLGRSTDGVRLSPSPVTDLGDAMIGLSGYPPSYMGWRQFRALGASALDLCAVADGRLDGYVDCSFDAHGPWDYLGATLVCREAGAHIVDASGRDLIVLEHAARRTPVAAGTPELLDQLLDARRRSCGS